MKHRILFIAALLTIMVGALLMRLPERSNRPMHGDEAVHALKFRDVFEKGVYKYNSDEFHGPTLYYAALPVVKALHRTSFAAISLSDYRLVIVLLGSAMILLLPLLSGGLDRRSIVFAGVLLALSPAFVYYSRDYIQETLLVFFMLGFLGCAWQYTRKPSFGWAIATGIWAGWMIATKETAVLAFVCAGIAGWITLRLSHNAKPVETPCCKKGHIAAVILVALAAACLPLSGFFTNPIGPIDYLRSYIPWITRAGETGLHQHPWSYYLQILTWNHPARGPIWTELLILILAVIGMAAALFPRKLKLPLGSEQLALFLTIFTLLLTIAYSLIPYKTPWCVLSFLLGMILLAGVGANTLWRLAPGWAGKTILSIVLVAGFWHLGNTAWQASYKYQTDGGNPYVYAQPSPDVEELAKRVLDIAHASTQGVNMPVYVISDDNYYWPIPWYLRELNNVGYANEIPADVNFPVVLASPSFDEALTRRLDPTHLMTGYFGLRPNTFFMAWVRMDEWKSYLDNMKRK